MPLDPVQASIRTLSDPFSGRCMLGFGRAVRCLLYFGV